MSSDTLPKSELHKVVENESRPDELEKNEKIKFGQNDSKKLSQLIRPEELDTRGVLKRFVDKHLILPKVKIKFLLSL
jgi:hypothetical protein